MDSSTFMSTVEQFVGIDVSKSWLDCYLRPAKQWIRVDNSQAGFERLQHWLVSHDISASTAVICMENTGVYDDRLLQALTQAGWVCSVEKTTVLEKVSPEHHRKDDAYDAAGLAEYAARYTDKLCLYQPTEPTVERLRQLYGERRRLVTQRAAVRSKQTQSEQLTLVSPQVEQSWQEQLAFYDGQIRRIEQAIEEVITHHEGLAHYQQLLRSIPGVGKVTGWLWLILFYGQEHLNAKKIASRFGYAPHSRQSGSSIKKKTRSSGHGSSEMRQCMCMAARSVSIHHQKFSEYKQRKMDEGKVWPVVRNNLINKLIKIMCAIWNNEEPYKENHTSRFDQQKNAA